MADNAHLAASGIVQCAQGVDRLLQRFSTQRTKSLVNEEHVYPKLLGNVAQCQRQRQRHEEALATRDGAGGSQGISLIGIDDIDDRRAWLYVEGIPVGEGVHVVVCRLDKVLEDVTQSDGAKILARSVANEVVETFPLLVYSLPAVALDYEFMLLLLVGGIVLEQEVQAANFLA